MHDFYQEYVSSGQSGPLDSARGNGPWLAWLVRRAGLPQRDARIVDAACGSGRLVGALRSAGYVNVAGVDLSREQIDAGTARGVQGLVCADAIAFLEKSEAGSLDAVFAVDFLEHLALEDALRFLRAARRSLNRDGRLVLHVPNGQSPFCSAVRYGDLTHVRAFTRRSLQQLLHPARLRLEWIEEGRPIVHGPVSLARRIIFTVCRTALAMFFMAETGAAPDALSQNFTALARPRSD